MNIRAILISLVVGLLTLVLLVIYLQRLEVETSGGTPIAVLAAAKPLEPGTMITPDMLSTRSVPQAYVESRAVRKADIGKIIGLKVESPVKAQQTVQWTDLAITSDDRRQLSFLVQPGMRAVGLRASHDDSHFALIRPGDRVDVYGSMPAPNNERERVSVLVVQNVIVLAVGTDTGARDVVGAPQQSRERDRDHVLTLSVSPQQLQLVSLAAERGKLTVGVRNPEDTRALDHVADVAAGSLVGTPQEKPKAAAPTKPTALVSPGATR